jgi:bifunctional UDP-N-acetylglucosamine pyrophosphorylase / glucosamine-1-phosphate N-acetyltransferase
MRKSISICILAAGKGTRLNQIYSKVLAPLLGKKLIDYPLQASINFLDSKDMLKENSISIVIGHDKENVKTYIEKNYEQYLKNIKFCVQAELNGTAGAIESYINQNNSKNFDQTLILCGDVPLVAQKQLDLLCADENNDLDGVAATFLAEEQYGYGRILKYEKGFEIIEEKEISSLALDKQQSVRDIKEVNSGLYLIKTCVLQEFISGKTNDNTTGEYYLTDLFQKSNNVKSLLQEDSVKFSGVNSMVQLESVQNELINEKIQQLQLEGVNFYNSKTNIIHQEVEIGAGSVIYPGVIIEGKSKIGKGVIIESNCMVKDSVIEDNAYIKSSCYIDQSQIMSEAKIGPFAHLRPNSVIGNNAKVGNFVEIKKAKLETGAKVSHLSYIGDATIGENSNIGCGFITCNYDGKNKHQTIIGKNSFIGSDCQAIAPINIGDNSFIACGSTLTQDVPSEAFAIARSKQITKEKMAKKFLKN